MWQDFVSRARLLTEYHTYTEQNIAIYIDKGDEN